MSLKDTANLEIYSTYQEFWPFYLRQHAKRRTRLIHVIGTFIALLALLKGVLTLSFVWILLALVFGYGFAWAAHMFIEKNHPATFTYSLWSLRGDLSMFWLWLLGRLETELVEHQILS